MTFASSNLAPARHAGRHWAHLVALALAFTALNALKPPIVDDGYFLQFARQIAHHPGDPFGFEYKGWYWPVPAFTEMCPPVFAYYLALGLRLVGPGTVALKLALFPFAFLFIAASDFLLRRFAKPVATPMLYFLVLCPLYLPGFNLMLDVPAESLILAAVAVFLLSLDRDSLRLALVAGGLGGLGVLTKYTGFSAPLIFILFALLARRPRLAVPAVFLFIALFCAWEGYIIHTYGHSNFLYHLGLHDSLRQQPKLFLIQGLFTISGATLLFLIPLTLMAAGAPTYATLAVTILEAALLAFTLLGAEARAPFHRVAETNPEALDALISWWVYAALGLLLAAALTWTALRLCLRPPPPADAPPTRVANPAHLVAGWLAIEIIIALIASPFPATRRLDGLAIPAIILVALALARRFAAAPGVSRRPLYAAVTLSAALGLLFYAVDLDYALAIHDGLEQIIARIPPDAAGQPPHVRLLAGFNAPWDGPALGYEMIDADRTVINPGDWVVLPTIGLGYTPYAIDRDEIFATPHFDGHIPLSTLDQYSGQIPIVPRYAPLFRALLLHAKGPPHIFHSHVAPDMMADWLRSRNRPLPPASLSAVTHLMLNGNAAQIQAACSALLMSGRPDLTLLLEHVNPQIQHWAQAALAYLDHPTPAGPPPFPLPQ